MAKTFAKAAMLAVNPNDPFLGLVAEEWPEGASQSYPDGSPVVVTSGYIVAAATTNPTSIWGLSSGAAHNTTAGAYQQKVIPLVAGMVLEANLMNDAAGADGTLATTDLGTKYDINYGANFLGTGKKGWFFSKTTGGVSIRIYSFKSTTVTPNSTEMLALSGDTNARVRGAFLAVASQIQNSSL